MHGVKSVCLLCAVSATSFGVLAVAADQQPPAPAIGEKASAIPLAVELPKSVVLDNGGKLITQVSLTNLWDKETPVELEFLVQQDPALYSKAAPHPLYGNDIAAGVRSWAENDGRLSVESNDMWGRSNGKMISINAMTDGRTWKSFGTTWGHNGQKWTEAFGYIDLGKPAKVVHMTYDPSDPRMVYKVGFAASPDGKTYTAIEGLQGVDIHLKTSPVEVDVPVPFEAQFIRMRLHNDGGAGVDAFRYPTQFHVYAGATEETFAFPQVGSSVLQGKLKQSIPAKGTSTVEIGDGRPLTPGSYLVAVRTRVGGVTQLQYGHIFVMPSAMPKVAAESRFGLNLNDPKDLQLAQRQGNGLLHYDNLRWAAVSPAAGAYDFVAAGQDSILRAYHEAGLGVLPCLWGTPAYLLPAKPQGDTLANPPTDLNKFGEFVFQTVARYGSQKHPAEELLTQDKVSGLGYADAYQMWGQPNPDAHSGSRWKGSLDDYYTMFRIGAEAARKADPNAKIVNGAWWGVEIPVMETMRSFKYPDGKCPLDFTDILSFRHFSSLGDIGSAYGIEPELASVYDLPHHHEGFPYERMIEQDLRALVAWRNANKPSMPIWATEAGFDRGSINEYMQTCWLPRGVMTLLAAGVDKVQVSADFLRKEGTLKPTWFTYATLIRQLDGVSGPALRLPADDDNVRVYLWKRGDKPIITAWTIKGTGKLSAALGRCTIADAFGASQSADITQSFALSEFPVYISDFADAAAVKAVEEQGKKLAEKEQRRLERQCNLQAYLYRFGLKKDRQAILVIGKPRQFTPVMAGDLYDASNECGFEAKALKDEETPWNQHPMTDTSVRVTPGTRFIFKAKPGEYVLQLCARGPENSKVVLRGLEGGEATIAIPGESMLATTTVKVGEKPVTLETSFTGSLVWMTLVQVDNE